MREIAQGSDGWYFENQKIEPTPEEIQVWENKFCDYCSGGGSLLPKKGSLAEKCEKQLPCPGCFGTGKKDHGKYFQKASHGKVISVSGPILDPNTFSPRQYVTVEFAYNTQSQQDGRPPHKLYELYMKVLHIGRAVSLAMIEKNSGQCPF